MRWDRSIGHWAEMCSDFEQGVRAIIGERIERVRYFDFQDIQWNYYPDFDAPPMGLELEMVSGRFFYATWDSTFDQFGILLKEGRMVGNIIRDAEDWAIIDVTDTSRWAAVLRDTTIEIRTFWWPAIYSPIVPGDIELTFASGQRIYVGAREPVNEGKGLLGTLDHVSVIFDDEMARRYEVGPYDRHRFDEGFLRDDEGNWRVPKRAR